MNDPCQVEYVIVGGGAIGLSIAYQLSQSQQGIAVIDRKFAGKQTSWAGAGLLPPATDQQAVHSLDLLSARSFELHPQWASQLLQETGIDNGFRRCGAYVVARTAGEVAALKGQALEWEATGIETEMLSGPELQSRLDCTALNPTDVLLAAYLPEEAQIRNPHHLQALIAACRKRGVQFFEDVGEIQVETQGHQVRSLSFDQQTLTPSKICFAAGPWTSQLLQSIGVRISLTPVRGQMLLFKLDQPLCSSIVYEGMSYIVPREDGHVLVGSTMEEAGFDLTPTASEQEHLLAFAQSMFRQLQPSCLVDHWAGLRPASFDGMPYIGELPGFENAWTACGHFRSGLLLSTGTAELISDLMQGKKPALDLSPFRVDRG